MSLPTLTGIARLTGDPELRFTGSGMALCSMQLAFNSKRQNKDTGQWEDGDVLFLKATAFKDLAEHVAESLTRGAEVVVTGRVKTEQWETRAGEKRSATALLLDSIGPSLRWATAKVNKAQRDTGTANAPTSPQSGFDDEPPF